MSEEENPLDVVLHSSNTTFDNLLILKELGNIANLVREEDFLEIVPKEKLRKVKWVPMFNFLKQRILDDMVQVLNNMWKDEDMPNKISLLEKQKEKFAENSDKILWRPQIGDVKAQLKAHDVANLRKQKHMLESLAKDYDSRVNKLKKSVSARRGYLKALQVDIQKYQKKCDECVTKLNTKLDSHTELANNLTNINVDKINWSESISNNDLENS